MAAFGTVFMPQMIQARFADNSWSESALVPSDKIELHAGAHVLHYSSTCFEGLKAFRHEDGSVYIFRMDANIARMKQSSKLLNLPDFDESMLEQMIKDIVKEYADETPTPPGSMYIRPTHIGTEAAIGKAAAPSMSSLLYVLLSPVGDYFSGGATALRVLLEEDGMRCAPHMGMVKSGGNYASALGPILEARSEHQADQILFCPGGDVQETGAANFILIDGDEIITKALDSTFLHGVTRNSILTIAKDLGMTVSERNFTVSELLERAAKPGTEAALSGTAAVLTSVGTLIHNDQEFKVGSGEPGEKVAKLRQALNDIQWGKSADTHGWLTKV
ncbi:branched-chain amino acid aminotransferase [Pseudoalteromonas shioyasakiensis]|jgi:branched-chain amino acid aminotransferase|uniref:Branched-chain-amino-acid aminotransferase n=3 Tax=Pseudoalteromonas TaxID=53246 RepID=A0A0P7DVT9_9GAMM|nr:branched-chain amino acid aminotransferase [Pseudoalteromonas lipolytica]KPW00663.1 Branched-chain-amino-acid aminotransferase 2 [Pseudoalteromonas sp. P1-8]KPZ73842.1 Branched-chain-amino-acid aminotransferase 2 [Pseudoalteromonas sp. P1-26]KTG20765.1 branched chain amino acid aminotransferase [Pseudoalteromonas sp. XI10]MCK8124178.1 branched-chain amino acid aminotransferase [Pseudoalteromonas sp. 2CM39R]MCO6353299.1 branched-chain amino acid aminotransferase [Pseudoalteromonas shioyasaki